MSGLRRQFLQDKAERDRARAAFDTRVADLRADYEQRGIAGRILDEVAEPAADLFDEAVELAARHPGAIAGTLGLIVVWFLRSPLLALMSHIPGLGGVAQWYEDRQNEKEAPDEEA